MARPTPAVLRAASILNLLAAHPTQSFTLTDILRTLKMNRATLHAVLAALVDVGYLYRANDKSYILGPSLVRIARVAKEQVSPLQAASPEMRTLANGFDAVCSATFRDRDELVVRERSASASHLDWAIAPNRRYALHPPLGAVFLAWSTDADVKRWLNRLDPDATDDRQHALASLEFPRVHGYACSLLRHEPAGRQHDIEASNLRLQDTEFVVTELEPTRKYYVSSLSAPVFDDRSQVAFALVLTGFPRPQTGKAYDRMGRALRDSCDRITTAIGGIVPKLSRDPPEAPSVRRATRTRKVAAP